LARWHNCGTEDLDVLQTIFWSAGASRNALAQRLAYSKSKANAMVAALLDEGLLDEVGLQESSGGRRAETLRLSETLGVVIDADLGATSMPVAVMRPDMTVLARQREPIDVRQCPGVILARLRGLMRELLARCGLAPNQVIAIGMGVPGPVDFESGQLVQPAADARLGRLFHPRLLARGVCRAGVCGQRREPDGAGRDVPAAAQSAQRPHDQGRHGHWLRHCVPRAGVSGRQWLGGRCGPHLCGPARAVLRPLQPGLPEGNSQG